MKTFTYSEYSQNFNEVQNLQFQFFILFLFILALLVSLENLYYLKNIFNRVEIVEAELNYLIQYQCPKYQCPKFNIEDHTATDLFDY